MVIAEPGDLVPHFDATTLDGGRFSYATIWQRSGLVLVSLAGLEAGAAEAYARDLRALAPTFGAHNATCVVTRDRIGGLPSPGAVVADQWGEIVHVAAAASVADLPPPRDLLDWAEHVQNRCPECEGEAK